MVDTQDHSGAGGATSTPSDSTSFCLPKKNKTHNKRLRPDDLNHDDRSLTVTTSTTTITGITDITPNTTTTTAPTASANEAPPPTKKLFSIFHFASNKGRSASSSSFVSSKRQPARHHPTTGTSTSTSTSINNNNSCEGRVRNIFVDLDGVLVDFDAGVRQLEQIHAQSKNPHKSLKFNMWAGISRRQHFYRTLPWTEDGKELWNFLVSLLQQQQQHSQTPPVQLHILTGVPWNSNSAAVDKFHWCQRELSFDITPTDANPVTTPPLVLEASTVRTDTGSSLPSTTNAAPSTTPLDSPRPVQQWHWNDMAAPKKAHARVNIAVPTRTGQQKFKGATSTTNTTTTQPEAAVGATEDGNGDDEYRPTVITCWSVNKFLECRGPGDVLIDDRPTNHDLQQKWERAGGVFLHHTSTRTTIQQLKVIFGIP